MNRKVYNYDYDYKSFFLSSSDLLAPLWRKL